MSSDAALNITIIGAGIAGLSTALALSHANPHHDITVLEAKEYLSELGAGIQLAANSVRVLDGWGLTHHLERVASEASRTSIRRWRDGREIGALEHNPASAWLYGWPHWQMYRPDLQRVLYGAVRRFANVKVLFGHAAKHVDHVTGTVTADDGEVFESDLVVAADGIGSKMRLCMPETSDLVPTPYPEHTYRAVIPRARMLSNPVTAALMTEPESKAWVGPGVIIMGYAIASGELYNVLVNTPRRDPDAPLVAWSQPGDVNALRGAVEGWCQQVEELLSLIEEDECTVWALGEVLDAPTYASESGRMALVGDAAHALLPHDMQGGGMAIEDAASLAQFLTSAKSKKDLPRVMAAWSAFRQGRVERLREMSRNNARLFSLRDGPAQAVRDRQWAAAREDAQEDEAIEGRLMSPDDVQRRRVARARPPPDPTARSSVEPGGAMWINGYDVVDESRRYCRQHLHVHLNGRGGSGEGLVEGDHDA
ncbi:Pol [Purpureocillium lavendulum]|uniref:Pol n=1 Tax=Purpureocillium lavendulum TaxID=1247861 RepID=A0AB34FDR9_9HYPO|nr:Pol [Purpureocillium lavendulum]